MPRPSTTFIIALFTGLAAAASTASAQERCLEGKTRSGECVNASLADAVRKQVIFMTQPKFSYTAPSHLPYEDRDNFIANDHHEIANFFYFPPPRLTGNIKP